MTKNEVELHRKERGRTALFIVSKIRIDRSNQRLECVGGDLTTLIGWNIDEWDLVPMAYQLKRRSNV